MRVLFVWLLVTFLRVSLYAQRLVLPGDYPDPSVVKIENTYWASATTSNWAPAYPLLKSSDLVHWHLEGHVFPKLPAWADYYFWAPEMSYENGKVYIYYAAHKRNGNLCVGVASADKPEGPYQDHGTLMCEPVGSIDAFPMRDENGKLYLIWKEDGNSVKQPTPVWAMEMNESRTALVGEKKELFRNDAAWEGNLVEGVSMIRHGEYYFAFYAGAGCCGRGCNYAMGVARARNLLGPWEKSKKNPLFTGNKTWRCPGHGTPVEKDGRFFFLYHAYHHKGDVYAGRQGVLQEFKFTNDGWIELLDNNLSTESPVPSKLIDEFNGKTLSPHWQWSVFQNPEYKVAASRLEVQATSGKSGTFLGQRTFSAGYNAEITVLRSLSKAASGIGIIGDEKNLIACTVQNNKIAVWKLENEALTIIKELKLPDSDKLYIKVEVTNGKDIRFSYHTGDYNYKPINTDPVDGFYLPPWDRALRVAVIAKGKANTKSVFDNFALDNK